MPEPHITPTFPPVRSWEVARGALRLGLFCARNVFRKSGWGLFESECLRGALTPVEFLELHRSDLGADLRELIETAGYEIKTAFCRKGAV